MIERMTATVPVYRSLAEIPADFGPSVAAIGNFDGVHRGHVDHQAVPGSPPRGDHCDWGLELAGSGGGVVGVEPSQGAESRRGGAELM